MKLTVDASIVAKWFLTEPQSKKALQLLAPRIRLHAPDILLVEYANVIWKKVHRREISDPQPYLEELARLPETVTLHRSADFLDQAARIAMEMDHPVYDCLYLACADATTSILITADHRFAKKAAGSSIEVWTIGSAGVADRIEMAATAPIIRGEKIEELIKLHEFFARTKQHVLEGLSNRTTEGLPILSPPDFDRFLDSPSYKRLVDSVSELADEERVDLLALGWLGAGHFNANWPRNLEHAYEMAETVDNRYVASYGRDWQAGYDRLKRLMQTRGWPALDTRS
ncbi:MAG: type II toxin-antitoxin system VapC family toxin [Acidobacteria bacterium]|nr:type II toxin-antitoxin system VapC family toxin [Acidobacteriota bacterium]